MRTSIRAGCACAAAALLAVSAGAQELRVFFGNLHAHTSYSDGSGTPAMAYDHARLRGLDFLAITEHNHAQAEQGAKERRDGLLIARDPALYNGTPASGEASVVDAARTATRPGAFVALYGQEFSAISRGNHANVFEVGSVIPVANGAFDELVGWLGANPDSAGLPAIVQFNHPSSEFRRTNEYGRDDFGGDEAWVREMGRHAALIEVICGPGLNPGVGVTPDRAAEYDYAHYLNMGFRLAPTANQDNHYYNWGDATSARTGVVAAALTREGILGALRARHVYATTDPDLRVIARVNGALCGDVIPTPPAGSELSIVFEIIDQHEPDAAYEVEVFSDDGPGGPLASVVDQRELGIGNGTHRVEGIAATGPGQYVFFRIYQRPSGEAGEHARSDSVWTAPVWMEAAAGEEHEAVASRHSRIYHTDPSCSGARAIKASNRLTGEEAMRGRTPHEGCPR